MSTSSRQTPPITGPYVSINQLTQFRMGHATTLYSAGPARLAGNALSLGDRLKIQFGPTTSVLDMNRLAQRTIPATVEQTRQRMLEIGRQLADLMRG